MKLLTRLGLVLVSLALSLTLAEGALRLRERGRPGPAPAPAASGLPELRSVIELATPGMVGLYKGQVHRNNRYGFRGPEPALAKPAGTFRIAVIGDSFTMGEGVADDETYVARLEQRLAETNGRRFEVLNLGLSGLNLRQSLALRLPTALRFDPDLLVYGFTINDLEDLPSYRKTRRPAAPASSWRLVEHARLAWILSTERLAAPGSYRAELEENYFDNPGAWSEFEADLAHLAQAGRQRGACVAMLIHAHLVSPTGWLGPIYEQVERAARQQRLHVTSSVPAFEGIRVERLWIGPFDSHPNAEGHERLADVLMRGLAALPEACWKGVRPAWRAAAGEAG
jgi:lysophospholipase L1-like esterase